MEIITTRIHQIWLLPYDNYSIARLVPSSTLNKLVNAFEFGAAEVGTNQDGKLVVQAQGGNYQTDKGSWPVIRLVIEERRILLDVEGRSVIADEIFDRVRAFLAGLSEQTKDLSIEPVTKAEESEIVARLSFTPDKLFPEALLNFVTSKVADAAKFELANIVVSPFEAKFQIQYLPKGFELDDQRITLARKEFSIGPRPGHRLEEKIYYSKAPVSTETHIQLLKDLEQLMVADG